MPLHLLASIKVYILSGLMIFSSSLIFAEFSDSPALVSAYRGKGGKILASSAHGKVTEQDLFVFLLMSREDAPLLFDQFTQATKDAQREAFRGRLIEALKSYVFVQELSSETSHNILYQPLDELEHYLQSSVKRLKSVSQIPPARTLDSLRLQQMLLPVHEVVWIDHELAPQVNVTKEDMVKYIADHPEMATMAKRAQVRYIFLRFPKSGDNAEAFARAEEIRQDFTAGRIDFESAAKKYSDAANAQEGGLSPEFEAGAFPPAFEQQAFAINPGDISPVVAAADGVYLIQGVSLIEAPQTALGQVDPKVMNSLFFKQLQHHFTLEVSDLKDKHPLTNKANQFSLIWPDGKVLQVRDFYLTADESLDLFPGMVSDDFEFRGAKLNADLDRMGTMELMAGANAEKGYASDPLLSSGSRIGFDLLRANQRLQELLNPQLKLTPEQILEHFRGNSDAYKSINDPQISMISVTVLKPEDLGEAQAKAQLQRMGEALQAARDTVTSASLDELAAKWPVPDTQAADVIPMTIEQVLIPQSGESVSVTRWNSRMSPTLLSAEAKALVANAQKEIAATTGTAATRGVSGKHFLPVVRSKDSIYLFYVEQPRYDGPGVQRLMHHAFYEIAANRTRLAGWHALRDERLKTAGFELSIP